jgi:ABC-type dipeptide/oligopeptide/nickel transport system permease subunit
MKMLKNKSIVIGLGLITFFIITAIFAPLLAPYNPTEIVTEQLSQAPFFSSGKTDFLLGTDDLGRDLLSRLLYGARISLMVGFLVVVFAGTVGILLGLFAGYYEGALDVAIMRLTDVLMAFPSILLAIVVVAIFGPGTFNAVLAVAIVALPAFIRITRAAVLNEKSKAYVQAAEAIGASSLRIMFREILPNCTAPLLVQTSLGFSDGILNVAALGFLGLGARPPLPEWGIMLSDARSFITTSPWMVTLPGICILLVVLAFNLLGDGLRDYFDPKLS